MQVDRSSSQDNVCGLSMVPSVGKGVVIASCLVAYRIIGPLASFGYLSKAAYHGLRLNYHWRHSRAKNERGELIPGTELNQLSLALGEKNYMNRDAKFNPEDLVRLQQERLRIKNQKAAIDALKWSRGFALCAIEGPLTALISEMDQGGSVEIGCCNCGDIWHHYTPEEMLEHHITLLMVKAHPSKNPTNVA